MSAHYKITLRRAIGLFSLVLFFLISGKSKAKAINFLLEADSVEIVKNFDTPAKYQGGTEALYFQLKEAIKYPRKSTSGTVYVKCTIGADGKAIDYSIIQGVEEAMDQAALDAFWKLDQWIPAEKDGKKVASHIVVPWEFNIGK